MKKYLLLFSLLISITALSPMTSIAQTESVWRYNTIYETLSRADIGLFFYNVTAKGSNLTIGQQQNVFSIHNLDLRGEIEDQEGGKYTITSIADNAFKEHSAIDALALPSSLEKIGSRAFFNCTSMNSVILSESLQTIGKEAFASCVSLRSIICPTDKEPVIEDMAFNDDYMINIYAPYSSSHGWDSSNWGENAVINYGLPKRIEPLDCMAFTKNETNLFEGWEWNMDTRTLIMKGVNIETVKNTPDKNSAVQLPETSTIYLAEGYSNNIKAGETAGNFNPGIYAASSLAIRGKGTMTVTGGDSSSSNSSGVLSESDITIDGGTVTFTGGNNNWLSYGMISKNGNLFVDSGTLTASSGQNSSSGHGILAIKSVIISNGSVTAKGKTDGIEAGDRIFICEGTGTASSMEEDGKAFNKVPEFCGGTGFIKGDWNRQNAEWGVTSGVVDSELTGLSVYGLQNRIYINNLSDMRFISVHIIDMTGKTIYRNLKEVPSMIETGAANGTYIVILAGDDGKTLSFKLTLKN